MPTAVLPAPVSPVRHVPASIPRPEYVGHDGPTRYDGPDVQTPETVERMRVAARIAAQAMEAAAAAVAPGVTTDELDAVAHEFMLDHGAYPSTLGYKGYPKSLCTSVNEAYDLDPPLGSRLRAEWRRPHCRCPCWCGS